VRINLSQRSARVGQMVEIFSYGKSAIALGNVGGNRDRCAANLSGEPVPFLTRKRSRYFVALDAELDGRLPDPEVTVITHVAHSSRPVSGC